MRGRSFNPDEATRIRIIQGLLQLKRDGHFHAVDVTGHTIRVQYQVDGPRKLMGWRRAHEMVQTAATALAAHLEVERKPPASEGARRATATAAGGSEGR